MEENKEIKQENNTEKKQIKIKFRTFIIILIAIIVIGGGLIYYLVNNNKCCEYEGEYQKVSYIASEEFREANLNNMINSSEDYIILSNYNQYKDLLTYTEDMSYAYSEKKSERFNSSFFKEKSLLVVECCRGGSPNLYTELTDFSETNNIAKVKISVDSFGVTADIVGNIYFIPISRNITDVNVKYENIKYFQGDRTMSAKPVIYIYPEEETEVSVELGAPEKLTCVYPEYNTRWNIIAKPDGTLINKKTGREYYSLYYESENTKTYTEESMKEGFVVSKEEIVNFLEEKLETLGLNYKEAEEFIIYWLPRLEANDYIYARFQTMDEIEENMPLSISEEPDTLIRIMMEWKGLDEKIEVEEQKLEKVTRIGFTVVEWGGTEIK